MDRSQIQEANRIAASELGITTVKGRKFTGSPADIGDLDAKDRIRVTDQLMLVLKRTPEKLMPSQVRIVESRIKSPLFQQPLEATGIIPVTAQLMATGELQDAMLQGAQGYVAGIGKVTNAVAGQIIPKQVWIVGGIAIAAYLFFKFKK